MTEHAMASGLRILELLRSFPAEGALFTTFTFSAAWFDAQLLRSLERNGIRRITILADTRAVAQSLSDGLTRGPGVRYTLEPVELPNGFFHAKVTFLWSRSSLLLACGSGNLTFSGMQKNLEAWDVLAAGVPAIPESNRLSRNVAAGLLGFLERLHAQVSPAARAAAELTQAISVLRGWLPRLEDGGPAVSWTDSFQGPLGARFSDIVADNGCESLEVVSPFFDPSGEAVAEVAQRCNAKAFVLHYHGEATTFPLGVLEKPAWPASSIRRLAQPQERPLHAKLVVARGKQHAWVLSGSANATRQALWTSDNVEAGLIRRVPLDALDELLAGEVAQPRQEQPRPFGGAPSLLSVRSARLRDRVLEADLACRIESRPEKVQFLLLDLDVPPVEALWPPDSLFRVSFEALPDPTDPRPIRLSVRATTLEGLVEARAWVSREDLLDASLAYRAALRSWPRLLSGNSGDLDEDDAQLLADFAEEYARVAHYLSQPAAARDGGNPSEPTRNDLPVPLQLLEAVAAGIPPHARTGSTAGVPSIGGFTVGLRAMFRMLDGTASVTPRRPVADDEEDKGEVNRVKRAERRVREELAHLEDEIIAHARKQTAPRRASTALLAFAALCARLVVKHRARDGTTAEMISSALRLVQAFLLPDREIERGALLPLYAAAGSDLPGETREVFASLLAVLTTASTGPEGAAPKLDRGMLREALDALDISCPPPQPERLLPEVIADDAAEGALRKALDDLRALPSTRAQARALLQDAKDILKMRAMPARQLTPIEEQILRAVVKWGDRALPMAATSFTKSCVKCHTTLPLNVATDLGRRLPVQCPRCSRWLVPVEG